MERNKDNTFGIIIVIIVAAIVVYLLFNLFGNTETTVNQNTAPDGTSLTNQNSMPNNETGSQGGYETNTTVNSTTTTTVPTVTSPTATAFVIKVSDLPEAQKTMLSTAGVTGDEIIITNEMKVCAEASIGIDRTLAISGGAKPTLLEGAKLVTCYNQ